ncbi:MerR family transcriptional regulator [Emergencia sp.]|uniref:MerR family transcriptional regulator n=1 Tax=Emergencia sp. TaxID=1926557 RepID=UPI003AEF256D
MNTYKTSEVAEMIGIHPNTVRLYEKLELIPKAQRLANGYRVFTDFHVAQLRLARIAFQIEVLQNGLRKKVVDIVKVSATGDFDSARRLTEEYLKQLRRERLQAEAAVNITERILSGERVENTHFMKRKEVSVYLGISMDTLRNWEMNGLLAVKRKENGYRVYTDEDLQRLTIIRTLRVSNYSLEAILRMLSQLSKNPQADIRELLNTPDEEANIITACDKLISSLKEAVKNAQLMIEMLKDMKTKFK